MSKTLVRTCVLIAVGGLTQATMVGCGSAEFASGKAKIIKQKEQTRTASNAEVKLNLISWLWPCGEEVFAVPDESPTHKVIEGKGPHTLQSGAVNSTLVKIYGSGCQAATMERDIVFVIDVSTSMGDDGRDPKTDGTCGRLQAVEEVMATVGENGNARFGLTTFADREVISSTGLFETRDELFADLMDQKEWWMNSIDDIVCNVAGGTDYSSGLDKGSSLLGSGREGTLREMYFISDGEPSDGPEAKTKAAALHADTMIGTVMLGDANDTILREDIASKDDDGKPLHARAGESGDLAKILSDFATSVTQDGAFSFSPSDSNKWEELGIGEVVQGKPFEFEAFRIDTGNAPKGIKVRFDYVDRFNNQFEETGELVWSGD